MLRLVVVARPSCLALAASRRPQLLARTLASTAAVEKKRPAATPTTTAAAPAIHSALPTNNPTATFPTGTQASFENEPADQQQQQRVVFANDSDYQDLTSSHKGVSNEPFAKEVAEILLAPIDPLDVEVKPDGMIYLPEIKYRRVLNRAFGPGGWGLIPRGPHTVTSKNISREYALFCLGRFVAQARGEQDYFHEDGLPTATEGAKSNALMRCCKDLGIASELWDPSFIEQFKAKHAAQVMTVNAYNNTRKMLWRRKDRKFSFPVREDVAGSGSHAAANAKR
ncbi:hypothetical protein HDU87_001667 [Geranomyces variabilis]|uniref:Mitochondrial genome maintenance protein MGM101 n=1 Tax=Geranomyces variabilis TaxID=109894 RepID=A0AAD5TPS1_9FUNG|nr:hypothetical protein HDU87_001667 [Geranomyces variabilis]